MAEIIPVQQFVYDKDRFSKVVNTQFTEFTLPEPTTPEVTVEEFFRLYEELFFEIPREGDINSHRYILNREAEFLGVTFADDINIQALLQEITDLRQQLLAAETLNSRLEEQLPLSGLADIERQELLAETTISPESIIESSTLETEQLLIQETLLASQNINALSDTTDLTTDVQANLIPTTNSVSTRRLNTPNPRRSITVTT
jgi:hypothetical protein